MPSHTRGENAGQRRTGSLFRALAVLTLAGAATGVRAQSCDGTWVPTMGPSGVDGTVYAMAKWDPDGPGPLPEGVLMGGAFQIAGNIFASGITWWNQNTGEFSPLGTGVRGSVTAVAVLPDGRVIAGGYFTMAGGVPAQSVAVWDGTHWSPLGPGIDDSATGNQPYPVKIRGVAGLADGSIVVGGDFKTAGGVNTGTIARWDGQSWSPLGGTPFNSNPVHDFNVDPVSGDLFIGTNNGVYRWSGELLRIPGSPSAYTSSFDDGGNLYTSGTFLDRTLRVWNRASWTNLRTSYVSEYPCILGGASGHYTYSTKAYTAAGTSGLATLNIDLNGSSTSTFGLSGEVGCLMRTSAQSLIAGGTLTAYGTQEYVSSQYKSFVSLRELGQPAKFEDGELQPLTVNGPPVQASRVILTPDGSIVMVGSDYKSVYRRDPAGIWSRLAFDRPLYGGYNQLRLVTGPVLLNDGSFVVIQGDTIYRRVGDAWVSIGVSPGLAFTSESDYRRIAKLANGDLVVSSSRLTQVNSVPVNQIARWNGQTWSAMGSGFTGSVCTNIAPAPNGDLIAVGYFTGVDGGPAPGIARWNGTAWSAIGSDTVPNPSAVAVKPNGNIIVSGDFTRIGTVAAQGIAEWDGSRWRPMGTNTSTVRPGIGRIATRSNGDVIVGGYISSIDGVAVANIARWDGSAWHPIGEGVANIFSYTSPYVSDLLVTPNDELYAAGVFKTAGNTVSYGIAHAVFAGNPPTITQQPADTTTCIGYGASFHVAAASEGSLAYRWSVDGSPLDTSANPSAATDTLVLAFDSSFGVYRCTVSNGCGSILSQPATLGPAPCCPDYNLDGNADAVDIDALTALMGGGDNQFGTDPDFNHDGNTDQGDIDALINVIAGGDCP